MIASSIRSQNTVNDTFKDFNGYWKDIEAKGKFDLKRLSPDRDESVNLSWGKDIRDVNSSNFLPSRFENNKKIDTLIKDEKIISSIGKLYLKTGSLKDTSNEFSVKDEQTRLDNMYNLFDDLSKTGKKTFKPIKDGLDTTKNALNIISDYNKSYYTPINSDDLIPTAYKFPLNTDVAYDYRNRISKAFDYSYTDYNPNEKIDMSDPRHTGWSSLSNGPYGILAWGESLNRYYIDLEGNTDRSETINSLQDNLNLGDLSSDIVGNWDNKRQLEKTNPEDMTQSELTRSLIDSLASAYYERATQDDDKAITSVITPSFWVLEKDNKILLKASFNSLKEVNGSDTFSGTYTMVDEKTNKSFDITINSDKTESYEIKGSTPIGEINHTYTLLSAKKSKTTDTDNTKATKYVDVLPESNISKEDMETSTTDETQDTGTGDTDTEDTNDNGDDSLQGDTGVDATNPFD